MQNNDWIDVLRLFPPDQQNTLILTTLSGMDLNVEQILRTEPSVLVMRGRVSGSTDDGRVFFIPYKQIDYLQINRFVREQEVTDLFERGKGRPSGEFPKRPSAVFPPTPAQPSSAVYSASTGSSPGIPLQTQAHYPSQAQPSYTTTARASAVVPGASVAGRVTNASGGSFIATPVVGGRYPNVPAAAMQPPPVSPRMPNVPAAALVPPANGGAGTGDAPTPPRNSILERLRAQRNAILPPRPPAR